MTALTEATLRAAALWQAFKEGRSSAGILRADAMDLENLENFKVTGIQGANFTNSGHMPGNGYQCV